MYMTYYYITEPSHYSLSELGNTISTLFGGGSSEPAPNVTEPILVSAAVFIQHNDRFVNEIQ